jgi:hypothetical protein
VAENLRHLVVGPTALAPLADDQSRRIDDAILKPSQKRPSAHGEQSRYGCIGESIPGGDLGNHFYQRGS